MSEDYKTNESREKFDDAVSKLERAQIEEGINAVAFYLLQHGGDFSVERLAESIRDTRYQR